MKIVFLDYVLEPDQPGRTGLSDVVWDMAQELVELGHDVQVIGPYPQHLAPDPRVKVHTIKVPPTGYRWFGGHLWICKRLADKAASLKADVIHAPEYVSTAVFKTLYGSSASQVVLTTPGNIIHRLQTKKGNPYSFFYTQCLKWSARKTAKSGCTIIATSDEMQQAWQATGSPARLTPMIPYGINSQRFRPVPQARQQLGLSADTILLLFVGRFSQEKAIVETIETFGRHREVLAGSTIKFQLFGSGPQARLVKQKIQELGMSNFITQSDWVPQNDLSIWYSAADALLLPSYTEGFGRVLIEAMICGTPVIGTCIAGAKDHIVDAHTGYLFKPGDFEALGDILEQVARNPTGLREMRSAVLAYTQENLTWSRIILRVINEAYNLNSARCEQPALSQGKY